MFAGQSPFNKPSQLQIVKLLLQETGTYNDMFLRPYQTTMDGQTLNGLVQAVTEASYNGQGRLDPATISGLASGFVTPSAVPEANISIANGWSEKRIRFILEIACKYTVGGEHKIFVQGFTTFNGVTTQGSIAPDMEFIINSMITVATTYMQTPMGVQPYEHVVDCSHLLADNSWTTGYQQNQKRKMCPEDIFSLMQINEMSGSFAYDDFSTSSVHDTRTVLKNDPIKSNRKNSLATGYATKIIDGYRSSISDSSFQENEMDILNKSRATVAEGVAATDPFLSCVSQNSGYTMSNKFKFKDLVTIDPNVPSVVTFIVNGHTQLSQLHNTGQTATWNGSDRYTLAATVLSQAVPAIMMDLMISNITFTSTNYDIVRQANTAIINGGGFSNKDLTKNYEIFKQRLAIEIIKDLTFNHQLSYAFTMRVDLLGETWLSLSLEGGPTYDYVTPSFCDSLFAPVITYNPDTLTNVSHDFNQLVTAVKDAMSPDTTRLLSV